MKIILLLIIRAYQTILSPVLGSNCRYYPTCSHYAHTAITHYGVIKGSYLAVKRILRCHPWADSGLDPVPGIEEEEQEKVMNIQFHDYQPKLESLKTAVVEGLNKTPKQLHPKFFYDEIGSQIFDRICAQPEYYIPSVEHSIYDDYADEMAECLGKDSYIIEPGAGSCKKIRNLVEHMQPAMYVPMDISADHLKASAQTLSDDYPTLPIHAICVDHTHSYTFPSDIPKHDRVFFYPGSSLGNFKPEDAIKFLHDMRVKAGDDGSLLIGIDTKKSTDALNLAYNDAAGATADFNLNLLERIKTELATDLDVSSFSHHAFYNEEKGRIEMHLISDKAQTLQIDEHQFHFEKGESIHTENSYKYTVAEFQALAKKAGWQSDKVWQDDEEYFAVYLLRSS